MKLSITNYFGIVSRTGVSHFFEIKLTLKLFFGKDENLKILL